MNSLIGLGVFGTFGQPFGFQQTFYLGVDFPENLDLDEDIIEVYPGNELFAVKRSLADGVYSVSFCIYSYVKELYSDRITTFMGTCVVLQDGYADAGHIYNLLRELHTDTLGNTQNVADNTIKVQQAQNLVVREPSGFKALQATVVPVGTTPYYSTGMQQHKKLLITPSAHDGAAVDAKVVAFFADALKFYTDTDAMYLSFDEDVARYAGKKSAVQTLGWSDFLSRGSQAQAVVRTKKGISKGTPAAGPVAAAATIAVPASQPSPAPAVATPVVPAVQRTRDIDPNRPFDVWEEPAADWSAEEARQRVQEYNRLFNYTNTLQAHVNEAATGKKKKKEKAVLAGIPAPAVAAAPATREKKTLKTLVNSKRKRGVLLLIVAGISCLTGGIYNSFFSKSSESIVSNRLITSPAAAAADASGAPVATAVLGSSGASAPALVSAVPAPPGAVVAAPASAPPAGASAARPGIITAASAAPAPAATMPAAAPAHGGSAAGAGSVAAPAGAAAGPAQHPMVAAPGEAAAKGITAASSKKQIRLNSKGEPEIDDPSPIAIAKISKNMLIRPKMPAHSTTAAVENLDDYSPITGRRLINNEDPAITVKRMDASPAADGMTPVTVVPVAGAAATEDADMASKRLVTGVATGTVRKMGTPIAPVKMKGVAIAPVAVKMATDDEQNKRQVKAVAPPANVRKIIAPAAPAPMKGVAVPMLPAGTGGEQADKKADDKNGGKHTGPKVEIIKLKDLRPAPNFEMSQRDINALARSGVKNKSVRDITRIVFQSAPASVGNVYRGQEMEYAATLLNKNKRAFDKVGNEFVCSSDYMVLHIPAYKGPRLPVVFPK